MDNTFFYCKCQLIINSFIVVIENTEDGSAGRDPFIKKLSAELVNLRSLLMAKSNIGLNGVLLTDNREGTNL